MLSFLGGLLSWGLGKRNRTVSFSKPFSSLWWYNGGMSQVSESLKRPVTNKRPMQDVIRLTLSSGAEPRELFGHPVEWVDMPDLPQREVAVIRESPEQVYILSRSKPVAC